MERKDAHQDWPGSAAQDPLIPVSVLAFATPTGAAMEAFLSVSASSRYQGEF